MYAIVEIAGQQFKVEKDQQIFVHRLNEKEGAKVEFNDVLLVDDKGKISVGAPAVSGAVVSAKVLEHLKGDKVIVFKKKRRKGYKVKNGHRQAFTKIQIEGIKIGASKATSSAKKEESKEEAPKAEKKADAPKADAKTKSAAPKKTTTKKETKPKTTKKDKE
ncbi:MAG: hypothetical protein Kow0079_01380 [Vicingaceae bacterium]